jgi:hypothetical protein
VRVRSGLVPCLPNITALDQELDLDLDLDLGRLVSTRSATPYYTLKNDIDGAEILVDDLTAKRTRRRPLRSALSTSSSTTPSSSSCGSDPLLGVSGGRFCIPAERPRGPLQLVDGTLQPLRVRALYGQVGGSHVSAFPSWPPLSEPVSNVVFAPPSI